jgi:VWFA-related protein
VRALLAVFLCAALSAQDSTIRTNVHLVLIPVTVTSHAGKSVNGLTADDFAVRDEEIPQTIRLDTADTVLAPVSVVFAIQASGISAVALAKIQKIGAMAAPLIAGDRGKAAVIAFDGEVKLQQDFTADGTKLRTAFETVQPGNIRKSRMLDAVVEGAKMLESRPENNRRVLFLLSESRDRSSKTKLPEAIEKVQRAGIAVYPITYSAQAIAWTAKPEDNPPMPGGEDYLGAIREVGRLGTTNAAAALAKATGGRHLSFATLEGLEAAVSRAGDEIHSQYLLSFTPAEAGSPRYHKLEVLLPGKPNLTIRARPGYWP